MAENENTPKQTVAQQMATADNSPEAINKQVNNEVQEEVKQAPENTVKTERADTGKKEEKPSTWNTWIRPIVVLVCICIAVSALLGITNKVTQPLIAKNTEEAAAQARAQVLPAADGFEDITPDPLPSNILSVAKATNDSGYVIEAYGKGYGGDVPAMVGFDTEGNITGVTFMQNDETPGLGQNLNKDSFKTQFAGLEADVIELGDIDQLAGATLSSNAALVAINAASRYYTSDLMGGTAKYEFTEEVGALLFPNADSYEALDVEASGVAGAYLGSDGTYVIFAQGIGNNAKPITVGVAMDEEGVILNLFVDAEGETDGMGPGKGNDIKNNDEFMSAFIGATSADGIDNVAGSTNTADGVKEAVQLALDTLPLAKEAA